MHSARPTRETYLRFVVGDDDEPAHRLDGVFVMSGALRDEGHLPEFACAQLDQLYDWFNAELPCPPFSKSKFPADALSWFRPSATCFIQRMWDFVAILREQGHPVRILKTENPGQILYRDKYQVLAIPRACSQRKPFRAVPFQDLGTPRPLRWTRRDRAKARRALGGPGILPVS